MSFQTYQPIEAGKTNVTMTTLARLADGLGVDPCALMMPVQMAPTDETPRDTPTKTSEVVREPNANGTKS